MYFKNKSIVMRKLKMRMSISVDGFVAGVHGGNDWVFKSSDEESKAWSAGQFREAGLIIMGRKSFQAMAPYWVTATGPFAAPMNGIPKALFTKKGFSGVDLSSAEQSPAAASWAGGRVFNGNLAEEISTLKQEPGKPVLAIGGAGFMRSLISTGLIDEYQLVTHPVVLGSGLPVFTGLTMPLDLKLAEVKVFPGGIIAHTYHPA
jgi:dihydrofolate reductase